MESPPGAPAAHPPRGATPVDWRSRIHGARLVGRQGIALVDSWRWAHGLRLVRRD
jgi:hypothetical protein